MKKLLVVVDYQNDFVNGSLGFKDAELIDGFIAAKVEAYRAEGADIVYTMDTHGPQYLDMQEGKKLPVMHCQNGTEGWKLYGKTGEACKDAMTIGKHTFGSMDLAEMALFKGYDQIEICGVVTNICVMANAVLAKTALPDADIIVDSALTASNDEQLHKAALLAMESMQIIIK